VTRNITLLALALILTASGAGAGDWNATTKGDWLQSSDWRSWTWTQEIGGDPERHREFGPEQDQGGGESLLSGRRLKAGGLSLLVPGAGQLYNGQRTKGLIMLGVEAVIWGTYLGFHNHANTLSDDYEAWAEIYAGVETGRSDDLYQAIGRYNDSDAWYESQLREARAFGESTPEPPGEDEEWQWRSEQFRRDYQLLRADANEAYDRRDMMILFAIVNRAISVFDAVRSGRAQEPAQAGSALGGEVLGGRVALDVSAPLAEPAARVSAAWSF
jgi:TM2 domain-containing membrane protein YozV